MTVALSAKHVSFTYPSLPNQPHAPATLHDIDFQVHDGEWLVVLGPTACGKTTLCAVLAGLAPQLTGGTLSGAVTRTDGYSIGLVFQDPDAQLFNMTVEDEIAFGLETSGLSREAMRERVQYWLRWTGIEGIAERPPWQLSGGQKKRVALAAVLAQSPNVLILDDPTAGLDPLGAQLITETLHGLRQTGQHALCLATSDPELATRYADRVLLMDAGQIIAAGSPQDVLFESERLRALGVGAPPLIELAQALSKRGPRYDFSTLDAAANALRNCAPQPVTYHDAEPPLSPVTLQYEQLWFQYPESGFALREINLSIARGSFVAIIGANGSGKTTLAKHANGLLRPTRGRVLLDGADIAHEPTARLARRVGYVFQNPDQQIFSASVREEIAFGVRNLHVEDAGARVARALEEFGLLAVADVSPALLGYGTRRLVTLASLWAMQPALWILDEPTTGLDARHADLVMHHARAAHEAGATIVLITHDLARVSAHAERVIVMADGRIAGDGTPREILADGALLARARLSAPPLVALARRLGWSETPLTVPEFMELSGIC